MYYRNNNIISLTKPVVLDGTGNGYITKTPGSLQRVIIFGGGRINRSFGGKIHQIQLSKGCQLHF